MNVKYILMIIVFLSFIAIGYIVNQGLKEHSPVYKKMLEVILSEDIMHSFALCRSSLIPSYEALFTEVKKMIDNNLDIKETQKTLIRKTGMLFNTTEQKKYLIDWLNVLSTNKIDEKNKIVLSQNCEKCLDEISSLCKTNTYIAIASSIIMVIILF